MTISECQVETIKHIEKVRKYIGIFLKKLYYRGIEHDKQKLSEPEVNVFAEYTPKLSKSTYGSEDYQKFLTEMKPALEHHYANCRHHPEHFTNGIEDMNLVDIVEMFCDWKAASLRQNDGNLLKSIETNVARFGCNEQLKKILINTAELFDEK